MKLETSPKVTKSKQSLHWCRSISKQIICAGFITVLVKKLLHYRAGGLLVSGVFITLSGTYYIIGHFITLSGTDYSIGRLLHYRLVHRPLQALNQAVIPLSVLATEFCSVLGSLVIRFFFVISYNFSQGWSSTLSNTFVWFTKRVKVVG